MKAAQSRPHVQTWGRRFCLFAATVALTFAFAAPGFIGSDSATASPAEEVAWNGEGIYGPIYRGPIFARVKYGYNRGYGPIYGPYWQHHPERNAIVNPNPNFYW
ncbi:hypothetical protein LOC68_06490 [Blastopirellula sp. JC732]|uniref:Uncharacterized protein n=1 Tax=Blastopirellula sediminis TaxID=2894196 RepID=A0A9X1MKL6_9BACT|nr:hypothetical protein [Blastopirellula sediminis]MCC9609186.1 hypothetical protein [Blastopirellula sediminis]MCC9628037.1 hypothetical protein [Blastopirellula sediminis]